MTKRHDCSDCTHEEDPFVGGDIVLDAKNVLWFKCFDRSTEFPWQMAYGTLRPHSGGYAYDGFHMALPVKKIGNIND